MTRTAFFLHPRAPRAAGVPLTIACLAVSACAGTTGGRPDGTSHTSAGAAPAVSASPGDLNAATGAPLPGPGFSTAATVTVKGDHLVDGSGQPVALRGVDLSGTEFACDQGGGPTNRGWSITGNQPLDQPATFAAIRSWQVHVVRIPLNEDCWLGINGVRAAWSGERYIAAIKEEVRLVHAAGMYAVLDLHWTAPGPYAAIAQQPLPDRDHSVDFWRSVSATFKDDRAVLFDLFNEPFLYGSYVTDTTSNSWDCWLRGCTMKQFVSAYQVGPDGRKTGYTTSRVWQAAGMQELIDAIRATGATQPVIVNGLDWANDLSGWWAHRPNDPARQLIVGWHSYPGEGCADPGCWDRVVAPISRQLPVLIGEVGDKVCTAGSYVDTLLPWADARGLSYLGWTWNPWSDCHDVLIRSWDGTPTGHYGVAYRSHLALFG